MKEVKFYLFFTIYLVVFLVMAVIAYEAFSTIIGTIDNYLLTVTIAIPVFIMLLFLAIIAAAELAFTSAFKNEKIDNKEKIMSSLKIILEGVGIVVIILPIVYLMKNTFWIINTGYMGLDIPLGGLIVSSLLVIGGICILAQVYVNIGMAIDKNNKAKKVKKVKAKV